MRKENKPVAIVFGIISLFFGLHDVPVLLLVGFLLILSALA